MTRYVRLEVDRDTVTLRFRGREGDSTPDLSLTSSGCRGMSSESDPDAAGGSGFTKFHSLFVAEVGETVSTFDISLYELRIVVSTAAVEARYDLPG